MRIVEDEGFCTACGAYVALNRGEENYNIAKKDLANYKRYKEVYINACPMCGFASTDITSEEGVLYGNIKDTKEYKQLFDCADLNGLDKELYEFHSADVPAGLYEACTLLALAGKDYEKAVRLLGRTIELKTIMARKYRESKAELGGEEENDADYDALDKLIKQSIEKNRKQIHEYYNLVKDKNLYLKLMHIENLAHLRKYADARKEYISLTKKIKLDDDLKLYFETLGF